MKRTVEVERFQVISDDGNVYTIIEYQEYILVNSLDNPNGEIKGLKSLITTTGYDVNYIDPVTFNIVITNEVVRKVLKASKVSMFDTKKNP